MTEVVTAVSQAAGVDAPEVASTSVGAGAAGHA